MPTPNIDTAIRTQIDQFLVSISSLVRQAAVEAVREALVGASDGEVSATAKRGRRRGRPRRAQVPAPRPTKPDGRAKRSSADIEATGAKVLEYIKANPGSRLEEIGRGLGVETAGLKRPIQGLLVTGALRTEGQKRGTKYLPASGRAAPMSAGRERARTSKTGKRAKKK
jgi:hypothetical protein